MGKIAGLVSVIIPTYNRIVKLPATINSILNQTYPELEVIVISDGFDRKTREVIESFRDRRIKYYEVKHSGRPAVPRNLGIRHALGGYIAFCDDDDLWLPEKVRLQMETFNNDIDVGLVYTKVLLKKEDNQERIMPRKNKAGFIFKELFLSNNFIANSTVLIKRLAIDDVGFLDEDIRFKAAEDFDLWLRIARKYKVGFVNKPLVIHLESDDNISKGILSKIRKHYLVIRKHYKNKNANLCLFIRSFLLSSCKSLFAIRHG